MDYDPKEHGAICHRCPLRGSTVVPPEGAGRRPPFAILVGEAPGEKEEEHGRPFVGQSGHELMRALQATGIRRAECHVTNAVLCRPPGNKMDRAERDAAARNKKILEAAEGDPDREEWARSQLFLSPVDACRPRLLAEIRDVGGSAPNVISLGGVAYRGLTMRRDKTLETRGGPREEAFGHLLPTLHPSFVMRSRRWTGAFLADLARARRWFTTGLAWKDPETVYRPTPSGLIEWLTSEAGSPFVVYDVETGPAFPEADRYDASLDALRIVGLASHDARRAIVIPFRSIENSDHLFYSLDDYRALIEILREFFASPKWNKSGWNSGYYDRQVIERHFKVTPAPHLDGIGLHKFVEPELPHGLGYVGSIYTDIHNWKQGKTATEARSDAELWLYNARDCGVTALSIPTLAQAVRDRGQTAQAKWFPLLQGLCVDMHKAGMLVDQTKRKEWDTKLLADAQKYLREIRDAVGYDDFNPGSTRQVRELLFDEWSLMPVDYTETGDPSTGDDTLREILAKQNLDDDQRKTIQDIRLYRRRTKYRGTYTLKFRPMREAAIGEFFAVDDEETEEEREARFKKESKRYGIALDDGRIHGDWNPHGTLGWRLSSSNPNMQNLPNKLRDMFIAPPGRRLVGCDQAQLELRMGAGLAKSVAYLEAFDQDLDPHLQFCYDIFGRETYDNAKDKKALRRLVKELTYASEYRAEVETVHSVLSAAEDDDERLLFPTLTVSKTAAMHRKWLSRAKFDRWWEETDRAFAAQGFLLDPILGLRCDFLDGVDDPQLGNKLVNFLCQSGGAAIVHLATKRFLQYAPPDWWERSKVDPRLRRVMLIQQGHDALVAEADDDIAEKVGKFLEECFTFQKHEFRLGIKFLGEMKVGGNWKEV